jgi:hypothetical protein
VIELTNSSQLELNISHSGAAETISVSAESPDSDKEIAKVILSLELSDHAVQCKQIKFVNFFEL